jgi:hypothetical protein
MALNIPNTDLPGNALMKGINTGSSMFSRLMQPVIEREKQKQQAEQFAQELALKKQAAARAGANSGLQRQILQQNLLKLQHSNDPNYEIQQLQRMIEGLNGKGGSQQSEMQQSQSQQMPTQEEGQGMGMFSPEGLEQAQQLAQQQPQAVPEPKQNGIDMETIKNSPILRSYFKKHFGIDPAAGESNVLHGPARDAADLAKLKKEVGQDSDVYQNAKAAYDAQVDAKKDLRDLRARTKAGLKPGEKEFFDEQTGEPLGKEIPLTSAERQSEEGNILFNELYPHVYKGAAPFSGEGSIRRLEQAAAHYKTDPKAKKMFDDFLLSEKMLAATTVNEASTLKAGRTNRTYNMLKESLDAQDVPSLVKRFIKEYKLPANAQWQASMRYQQILSKARQKARKGTPATQKLFYNPEKQAEHEAQSNEGLPSSDNETQSVVVIDPNGKKFETTEANAAHLPEGWKRG